MISVKVTVEDTAARSFLARVSGALTNRRGLNAALAGRLADDIKAHFGRKNAIPNKMAAPKTNFWQDVADDTMPANITDTGASVLIASDRFRIHLFGGTILPKKARALTIPLVASARGRFARDYEKDTGHRLFRVGNVLAEKDGSGIRPVYALARSARIPKDPAALPPAAAMTASLQDEADDFIQRTLQ